MTKEEEAKRINPKTRTVILGIILLFLLIIAYSENNSFFGSVGNIFSNPLVAIFFIFVHNILVISLILLGMTFYVGLVVNFMPNRKEEYVILHNPRIFAIFFTLIILFISILRASTLVYGQVFLDTLFIIILLSTPNAIIEGYGIFQIIERTLKRETTLKTLFAIYLLFFLAAIIEVGYVYLLNEVF
ncbi:hypothetical protein KJN74_03125 [Candidatus Bathyarchaeota archaeon]|nr:hypothetical protein [Candidatus Bathyarchaeota archaeon]